MAGHLQRQRACLLALLVLALVAAPFANERAARAQAAAKQQLVVIVAHTAGITDISLSLLRRAFSGEQAEYRPGKRLIPLNHPPNTPERVAFDRVVLGLDPAGVGRFWIARRIRDEGFAPRTFPSSELGMRAVAAYPGIISYVRASAVTANVRVLTIDQIAVGQKGYPFPSL